MIVKWLCYKQIQNLIDMLNYSEVSYNDKIERILKRGYTVVSVDLDKAVPIIENGESFFICNCGLLTSGCDEFHFPIAEFKNIGV